MSSSWLTTCAEQFLDSLLEQLAGAGQSGFGFRAEFFAQVNRSGAYGEKEGTTGLGAVEILAEGQEFRCAKVVRGEGLTDMYRMDGEQVD
jgi:hypothetical protein